MYVRQAKQFLRSAIDGFDERNYGFASVNDLLRAAGKEGVLRVERDRQGAVRVFAGPKLTAAPPPAAVVEQAVEPAVVTAEPVAEPVTEAPIVEAVVVEAPVKAARRRTTTKPKAGPDTPKPRRTARARKSVRAKDVAADRPEKRRQAVSADPKKRRQAVSADSE
jgi:hypothetical protein